MNLMAQIKINLLFLSTHHSGSPKRVSSLFREQLLTHTCFSNVYRSWWREHRHFESKAHNSKTATQKEGDSTLFCFVLGSYFPILVIPVAPYRKGKEASDEPINWIKLLTDNLTGVSETSRLTSSLPWLTLLTGPALLQNPFFGGFRGFKMESSLPWDQSQASQT